MELDTEQLETIRKLSGIGVTPNDMAHVLGIDATVFVELVENDAQVKSMIERGRAEAISTVASKAYQHAINAKDWKACFSWLKIHAGWKEDTDQVSAYKPIIIEFLDGSKQELSRKLEAKKNEG